MVLIAACSPASIVEHYFWILELPAGICQVVCILRNRVQLSVLCHTTAVAGDSCSMRFFSTPVVLMPCSLHLAEWHVTLVYCKPARPQGHCTAAAGPWGGCERRQGGKSVLPFSGGAPLLLSNPGVMKYIGPSMALSSNAY